MTSELMKIILVTLLSQCVVVLPISVLLYLCGWLV